MKVLLLSAYDSLSHRYWRIGLVEELDDIEWTVLTLPPRFFSWRIRGNPLSWAQQHAEALRDTYDCVIATSMVDVATLRGIVPSLANTPLWLYCHENQFEYPESGREVASVEAAMVMIYACMAADHISFNSAYNRDTTLAGITALTRRLPERIDQALLEDIEAKSSVLPVPLRAASYRQPQQQSVAGRGTAPGAPALHIVWNHRWEYDKGPDRLLAFVRALLSLSLPCTLHVVGQQFREQPAAMSELAALLGSEASVSLGSWGYIESYSQYLSLLASCHVVISTAEHDFQGLAVLEAVACGCIPLLPLRLAYPEFFAADYLYSVSKKIDEEAGAMASLLQRWMEQGLPPRPSVSQLGWPVLRERYHSQLLEIAEARRS